MATITIGANNYTSFQTVAGADLYLAADIVRSTAWALLNDDFKGRALVSATRLLLTMPWCGTAPDPAVDQVEPIPSVTAMLAADLASKPKLFADASSNSNIKRAKAGPAEIEFFSPVDGGPPLPLALWKILLGADLMCPGGEGDLDMTLAGAIPTGTSCCPRPLGGRYPWDWPIACEDYT